MDVGVQMPESFESRPGNADRGEPLAVEEIERIAAPTGPVFARRYLRPRRPVVLTGLTQGWSGAEEWAFERMAARYGSARVVAATLVNGVVANDSPGGALFHRIILREFVESLAARGAASDYVMAPTWDFPPAFQQEYRVPPYCAGAPHLRAKVWLGKAGTVTPVHRDVPHNLHVHLSGRKRWLLFPPGHAAQMYPRGLLSPMPNFAKVDPEEPDYERYPRFREATGFGATLHPGETLFVPRGWWHHTRSVDNATGMNFWWGGTVVSLAALASTIFKRVRGLRSDEWA